LTVNASSFGEKEQGSRSHPYWLWSLLYLLDEEEYLLFCSGVSVNAIVTVTYVHWTCEDAVINISIRGRQKRESVTVPYVQWTWEDSVIHISICGRQKKRIGDA